MFACCFIASRLGKKGDLDSTFQYSNLLLLALFFLQLSDFDRKFKAQCLMLKLKSLLCLD